MDSREEIPQNQFFLILKNLNQGLYKEAGDNQYTICVPQGSSLGAVQMNEDFCKMHILVSSPYFKSEYTNLLGQCVELRDRQLHTKTGFDEPRVVDILFEELFYNDQYESFGVLCISAPLSGRIAPPAKSSRSTRRHTCVGLRSESEWLEILRKHFGHNASAQIIRRLEKFSHEFNKSYVLVKGFTDQAGLKVFECIGGILERLRIDDNAKDEVAVGIEVYLTSKIHKKVMSNLNKQYAKKNNVFASLCGSMKHLTLSDLDLSEAITCDLTDAAEILLQIETRTNPVAQLYCIFESCQQLTSSVRSKNQEEHLVLAADDILMLFTYLLIQAKPTKIYSNLEYMSHFHRPRHSTAQLDYAFATFQGAVHYIANDLSKQFGVARNTERRRSTHLVRVTTPSNCVSRPSRNRHSRSSRSRNRSRATSGVEVTADDLPIPREKREPLKFEKVSQNPLLGMQSYPI